MAGVFRVYLFGAIPDHERLGAMLTRHIRMAALLPFLQSEPPAGGGNGNENPTPPPANDGNEPLGEPGKKALEDEREARKEADKRARAAEKKLADIEAAAQQKADEEAAEQGEWKTLAERREADLQSVTTDRDSLKARVETLEKLAADRLKALIADLPKEFQDLVSGDDTPVEARLTQAEKAAKAHAAVKGTTPNGNRPNPNPAGNTKPDFRGVLPRRQLLS